MTVVQTPTTAPAFTVAQLDQIQGFGIAGFRKDHQEALFVRIGSPAGGQELLGWLQSQIATASEVGAFNALFKEVRARLNREPPLAAVWTAVMISAAGLRALGISTADLTASGADAFGAGMAARSSNIGDSEPSDVPTQWLAPFQPGANQVHLAIVVAADEEEDLDEQVTAVGNAVSGFGCEVVLQERGDTLPMPLTGHEHFGFEDGISQPIIQGYGDPPQPSEPLPVAAGEIVLGYPDNTGATAQTGTAWANGSFVVFRRLRQDVAGFRTFVEAGVQGATPPLQGEAFAARLVGRWPDGAPVETNATADPGPDHDTNAFGYSADQSGLNCPVWAHVRKANPRDTVGLVGTPNDPAHHRMLRRGIPFGTPLADGLTTDDGVPRGLHFFCVVAAIDRQFEFVQANWLNNPNFPLGTPSPAGPYGPPPTNPPNGPDPVVGEHDGSARCILQGAAGPVPFPVTSEFVHVTAGEYFFLPALSTIAAWGTQSSAGS